MNKRIRVEGSAPSQFVQLIRKINDNDDLTIETATVISPPPSLKIRLGDGIEVLSDEIIVANHLTAHTRQATIDGINRTIDFHGSIKASDKVIVICLNDKMRYFVIDKAVI